MKLSSLFGIRRRLMSFAHDRSATVAVTFGLALVPALIAVGAGVDYANSLAAKTRLQTLADGAALAGAKSISLSNSTPQTIDSLVKQFVVARRAASEPAATITSTVSMTNKTVAVQIDEDFPASIMRVAGFAKIHISVNATGRFAGHSAPNCMVALDASAGHAIEIDQGGVLGPNCMIYSNSNATDGIKVTKGAQVSASQVCSGGGIQTDSRSAITGQSQTDCPVMMDPMAGLAPPSFAGCTQTDLKLKDQTDNLVGGVYCGGLEIGGASKITLSPGLYVIKDGPLKIKDTTSLKAFGVTFYLTGQKAVLDFDNGTALDLSAPSGGPMGGVLVFEDRAAQLNQHHQIKSRNAPNMLGAIYLSRGTLDIGIQYGGGGTGTAVASSSAWTVVVARQVKIQDDMQIAFNTYYDATTVKPPAGITDVNATVTITR